MDANHPSEVVEHITQALIQRGLRDDDAKTAARSRYERLSADGEGRLQYRLDSGIRVADANHLKAIEDEAFAVATAKERETTFVSVADRKASSGEYTL